MPPLPEKPTRGIMGIKLDWEVESDGGWEEVGEDPAAIAARKRRVHRLRNLGLVLLVALGIAGGAIFYRLHRVGRQLRADLETTISAETLALRIGDRRAFLDGQADVGEWVRIQDSTFAQYQALGPDIEVTGEVVELDIDADKARVVLREDYQGEPYHIIWFYQHSDAGWLHIPPGPEFWGKSAVDKTAYANLYYYEEDADLADLLRTQIDDWWNAACRATDCAARPRRIRIRIEPDPLTQIGWASYDDSTLLIPSPKLSRFPAGRPIDPALLGQLAELAAGYWASSEIGDEPEPYSELAWLEDELAVWVRYQFDPEAPPSTFLGVLAENYGVLTVRKFIDGVENGEAVVPTIAGLTGVPAADLPVAWDGYLAYRLRAEAALIANGFSTEAAVLYRDPERADRADVLDVPTESIALPDSIEVIATRRVGDILWAEVQFAQVEEVGRTQETTRYVAYEPFRLVDNRWVHTNAIGGDWGPLYDAHGTYVQLWYFELDGPAAEGLVPHVEEVYTRIAADFALPNGPPALEIFISPVAQPDQSGSSAQPVQVFVPSPYVTTRPPDVTIQEHARSLVTAGVIEEFVAYQIAPFDANHPFAVALMRWEMERTGLDAGAAVESFLDKEGRISALWPGNSAGSLSFSPPYSDDDYLAAYALIRVLTETYGPEVIPNLVAYLPLSETVDEWLILSAGVMFEDVLDPWQAAYTDLRAE
jgi:hypothetical protein